MLLDTYTRTHTPQKGKKKKKMIKTENILDFLSINYHNWPKKGNGIQFEDTKNNIKDTKNNEQELNEHECFNLFILI